MIYYVYSVYIIHRVDIVGDFAVRFKEASNLQVRTPLGLLAQTSEKYANTLGLEELCVMRSKLSQISQVVFSWNILLHKYFFIPEPYIDGSIAFNLWKFSSVTIENNSHREN